MQSPGESYRTKILTPSRCVQVACEFCQGRGEIQQSNEKGLILKSRCPACGGRGYGYMRAGRYCTK